MAAVSGTNDMITWQREAWQKVGGSGKAVHCLYFRIGPDEDCGGNNGGHLEWSTSPPSEKLHVTHPQIFELLTTPRQFFAEFTISVISVENGNEKEQRVWRVKRAKLPDKEEEIQKEIKRDNVPYTMTKDKVLALSLATNAARERHADRSQNVFDLMRQLILENPETSSVQEELSDRAKAAFSQSP